MANVAFSQMYDLILPYIPGADTPIIDNQIRKAVREFMKRTTVFREGFAFSTVAGVNDYQLLPATGMVSAIIDVWLEGSTNPLPVATEDRRPQTNAGAPRSWYETIPGVVSIYPQPDGVYNLTLNGVKTLKQDDVLMPEELIANYGEEIAAGVMSLLMSMPGKPWTQSKSAVEYGRVFSSACKTIRGKLRDGGKPNQSTFTPRVKFGV